MTNEHDNLRDLLAPVALGAAEPAEVARVEAHAAECAICREELAGLRDAAGILAVSVPQEEAPPALKDSIMSIVRAEAAERAEREESAAPAGARARPAAPPGPPAAGAPPLAGARRGRGRRRAAPGVEHHPSGEGRRWWSGGPWWPRCR